MVSRLYAPSAVSSTLLRSFWVALLLTLCSAASGAFALSPLVGGDDAIIDPDLHGNVDDPELVKTSDGKLFCALSNVLYLPTIERTTTIYQSLDNGTTWNLWSTLPKATGERTQQLRFLLAEGTQSRLHILYRVTFEDGSDPIIRHAWTNPNSAIPVWNVTTPFSQSGYDFTDGDLASDVSSFGDYYLYAVATGSPAANQQNLYFARSTNKGDSWEASYALTGDSVASPDYYLNPHIAFGGNDRIHLSFDYGDNCLGSTCINNSARTMYADNFATSGLSDWSSQVFHTLSSGTVDSWMQGIAASPTGSEVYILYLRNSFGGNAFLKRSLDGGSTWAAADTTSFPAEEEMFRLFFDPTGAHLYVTGRYDNNGNSGSCDEQPIVLDVNPATGVPGPIQCFSPTDLNWGVAAPGLTADPVLPGAFGVAWVPSVYLCGPSDTPRHLSFDATWFTDPGHPNLEPGFPVALDHVPATPPAIAYLGTNAPHAIVYSDTEGRVHALSPSGFEYGGWPQDVGDIPSAGQVAIGDLNGDGLPAIVVGNTDGEIWAFDASGVVMPGFPYDTLMHADTYVAVGAVLAPYPRSIVACSGDGVYVLNYRGALQAKIPLPDVITAPPSIGDVDGDDQPDLVVAAGSLLYLLHPDTQSIGWSRDVTLYSISGPPTLADMDLDGMREILVPTVNGFVHAYDSAGNNPWSIDTGTGSFVTRVAAGQLIGTSPPEITFCAAGQMYEAVNGGTLQSLYPKSTAGGAGGTYTDPVIESLINTASANIANSSMQEGWAWTNTGFGIGGWPKSIAKPTQLGSAVGDVDDDSSNEIVVLSDSLLSIWDVNHPPQSLPDRKWPMVGGDPGRTNCWQCESAVVTAVEDSGMPTHLSFAPPRPNPTGGSTVFSFALPRRAGVEIDLYDVRGRRVRQVVRTSLDPGEHVIRFDGRDDRGRPLANGEYFARLQVRGGGVDRTMVQKLTLLR